MSDRVTEDIFEKCWRLEALVDRFRDERDMINRTFCELCDALGCEYDNEAALMAVHALKHPEQ